jgi:phage gp29-like protein
MSASTITIYDAYDRPIDKAILDKEVARPSMTGIRSIWHYNYMTGGLTPQRLALILKNATEGMADEYLTLAEEMEEKDLHYASVLGTRKRAVARLPIVVESASDDPEDVKIAQEIRNLFKRSGTKGMIEECLDALGKGYSVVEICWDKSKTPWVPVKYIWRDPRFFLYDRETLSELRMKDETDMLYGVPLAPYKFIVHTPRLKTGIPIRGGIARLAAWAFVFKNFTVKDWVAFCEVFGMPLRLGKYLPGETEDNIAILRAAVANLGSDAAAVIPEGMLIEFIEAAKAAGESPFERVADWFDKQLSKGILGQTMTADDGSSRAQAAVHNEVRGDIRDGDTEQLAETLERDLVVPYICLNYGPRDAYPRVFFREPEQTDIPVLATALNLLVPLGLTVEVSEVRDKLGFSDPAPDAVCLTAPAPPPQPFFAGGDKTPPPGKKEGGQVGLNSEQYSPATDVSDTAATMLQQRAIAQTDTWVELLRGLVKKTLDEGGDLADLRDSIAGLFPAMKPDDLGAIIAQATTMADCAGRLDVQAAN